GGQAARVGWVAVVPRVVAGRRERDGVDNGRRGQRLAAHLAEGHRREQTHGGDDDQRACVPEQMREIELWRGWRGGRLRLDASFEEIEETVQSIRLERARRYRPAQDVFRELHQSLKGAARYASRSPRVLGLFRRP